MGRIRINLALLALVLAMELAACATGGTPKSAGAGASDERARAGAPDGRLDNCLESTRAHLRDTPGVTTAVVLLGNDAKGRVVFLNPELKELSLHACDDEAFSLMEDRNGAKVNGDARRFFKKQLKGVPRNATKVLGYEGRPVKLLVYGERRRRGAVDDVIGALDEFMLSEDGEDFDFAFKKYRLKKGKVTTGPLR